MKRFPLLAGLFLLAGALIGPAAGGNAPRRGAASLPSALLLGAARSGLLGQTAGRRGRAPRLVVLISIDQFRADYLERFADLYLPPSQDGGAPGGFRYLKERGAWYADCRYDHYRTVTAVGHAVLGTGAQPSIGGIVGNSWWDTRTRKTVYCVDDPGARVIGAESGSKETPMSAANLDTTTTADELELATGGASRTVALALKDRAAILLIGHRADTAIWFDEETGGWVSSSAYCKSGTLPAWVTSLNGRRLADQMRQQPWTPSVEDAALARTRVIGSGSRRFTHALTGRDYLPFATSPQGNAFVFDTAKEAVRAEELGRDEVPDFLAMNLSSNDYVGHRYGPDSAEVLDISVRTDRQLADFLGFLNRSVPGGLAAVTIAISADHGVVPIPELQGQDGVPVARAIGAQIVGAAERALDAQVGAGDWIASSDNGELSLHPDTVARFAREPRERLEHVAVAAVMGVEGVLFAVGKSDVLAGRVPRSNLGRRITQSLHPHRSGDVIVILKPQWLAGGARTGTGTSHGSPHPDDTHVPLLIAGAGFRAGTYTTPVSPARLAPSLSHVLRVGRPSGADEPLLPGLAGAE